MNRIYRFFVITFCVFLLNIAHTYGFKIIRIDPIGQTWNISEKNLLEVIQERIIQKGEQLKNLLKNLSPQVKEYVKNSFYNLPPAENEEKYTVKLTWVVPTDVVIPDVSGKLYYWPEGTEMNLLEHFPGFPVYIVFNPELKRDIEIVTTLLPKLKQKYPNIRGLVTGIPSAELPQKHVQQLNDIMNTITVRPLIKEVAEKLNLKYTVSVVIPDYENKVLLVRVYSKKETGEDL